MRVHSYFQPRRSFTSISLVIIFVFLSGCTLGRRSVESIPTVDENATNETKALFMNLWILADTDQTLFGHQDDLAYGVGWSGVPGRSDVLEASVSDEFEIAGSYPAVYGWDVSGIGLGGPTNVDGVAYDEIRDWIIEGYQRGSVITISWHMTNPVTGENFYDRTSAVSTILPGGANHAEYIDWLDAFAEFDRSLTVSGVPWNENEHQIPVIFRPFHEHNCRFFWWGRRVPEAPNENATEDEYIELWQFTVEYLRDQADLHNLIYAYSPSARCIHRDNLADGRVDDLASFQTEYFYAYPGDDYVDVLGLDNYADVELYHLGAYMNLLDYLVETANQYDETDDPDDPNDPYGLKIPALTETGGQQWSYPAFSSWWTNFLYPALIGTRSSGGQVAWVLTWRNTEEAYHHAPYAGGPSAENFAKFKDKPMIHFEDEIPFNLYTWP